MAKQLFSFRFPSLLSVDGCEGIGTFEFVIESNLIFPWSAPCPLMATPEFTALEQRGRKFKIRFGPAAALDWPATIIQMSLHCHHHQNHPRQKGMPAKFGTIVPAPPRSNPSPNTSCETNMTMHWRCWGRKLVNILFVGLHGDPLFLMGCPSWCFHDLQVKVLSLRCSSNLIESECQRRGA